MHLFLDSEPASLLSNPSVKPEVASITQWLRDMRAAGHTVYLPEIIDYELRRELIRASRSQSVLLLNQLGKTVPYVPLNADSLPLAADLWAWARNVRLSTGDPKKLDIDVILAAQALTVQTALNLAITDIVVVTSNVAHLSRFIPAAAWIGITP